MNIVVEDQTAPCQKRLKIEVPADRVNQELERITLDFQKQAKIPGFRQGKVPRPIIEKRFTREIEEELKRSFVQKVFSEAIQTKNINMLGSGRVEDLKYQRGLSLSFSTLIEVTPEFNLPDYKAFRLPGTTPIVVTDEDVENTLQKIVLQYATYEPVETRAVEMGDFVIVSYTAQLEGKPLAEAVPATPKDLNENKNLWIWIKPEGFLPGFIEQLLGMRPGEEKQVRVTLPENFGVEELRGKTPDFSVKLLAIKKQIVPTLDENFSQEHFQMPLEDVRSQVKRDLEENKTLQRRNEQMQEILKWLENSVQFELPPTLLAQETQRIIYELVERNRERGINDNQLEEHRQQVILSATQQASAQTKLTFLITRIAAEEKLKVSEQDMIARVTRLAQDNNVSTQKIVERIQKANAFDKLQRQLLHEKTLDFLLKLATQEPTHG